MDILIGGLDAKRARALEADVRRAVSSLDVTDVITIAVLPSDADNRWDVGVRRSDGWSVTWFDSAVENLSAEVATRVRASMKPAR